MSRTAPPLGALVRSWRELRHVSQLDLASEADISQRHLRFIESGRAAPSRAMIITLASHLDVPLRERNSLLLAAGFAPIYKDRPFNHPGLVQARAALERLVKAHEPYPALIIDRLWTLVRANAAVAPLLVGADPELRKPPVNLMRLSLHPKGLAPLIENLAEWRAHLLDRLQRQHRITRDPAVDELLKEITTYPDPASHKAPRTDCSRDHLQDAIVVPLRLRTRTGVLSFLSTVTVFGTAIDITLSELSLEAFYPADEATEAALMTHRPRASRETCQTSDS